MLRSIFWKPYSHLFIIGDNSGWSTDVDASDLRDSAEKLGVSVKVVRRMYFNIPQSVHYTSQFSLLIDSIYKSKHRLSVDYYHGKPDQQESFKKCFEALKKNHHQFGRVRVSTKEMEALIKSTGIDPYKVMRIPIGIDTQIFKPLTHQSKSAIRNKLDIPEEATVIGSFQKDGNGWDDGNEPKYIKGPDAFLQVIERLKKDVPNLWVLLSGPARGYVKSGLEKMGVPYRHEYFEDASKVADLYDALDLYIITSREEGGPKAFLESLAKGVPLVTTAVGQCQDLVISGKNAMMAPIDDIKSIANFSLEILRDKNKRNHLVANGFKTVEENSLKNQLPLWEEYFDGLLNKTR